VVANIKKLLAAPKILITPGINHCSEILISPESCKNYLCLHYPMEFLMICFHARMDA
jgi:hypothetical protein